MKIGLMFGSFNPIHIGHLIIANSILDFTEEVWFVISPQNPFKSNSDLVDINIRTEMLKTAIKPNNYFHLCDIELSMPVPSYTSKTLKKMEEKFPEQQFFLVMGSDNYLNLPKWKNSSSLQKYGAFIYERPDFLIEETNLPSHVTKLKTPLLNISATEIRKMISNKKSIRYLVPDKVIDIINENNLYL